MVLLFFFIFVVVITMVVSHGMRWYENFLTPFWKPNGFLIGEFFSLIFVSGLLSYLITLSTVFGAYFKSFVVTYFIILYLIFLCWCIAFFVVKKMLLSLMFSILQILFVVGFYFALKGFLDQTFTFLLPLLLWSFFAIYLSYNIRGFDIDQTESQ